jgi:hypothetical protein
MSASYDASGHFEGNPTFPQQIRKCFFSLKSIPAPVCSVLKLAENCSASRGFTASILSYSKATTATPKKVLVEFGKCGDTNKRGKVRRTSCRWGTGAPGFKDKLCFLGVGNASQYLFCKSGPSVAVVSRYRTGWRKEGDPN